MIHICMSDDTVRKAIGFAGCELGCTATGKVASVTTSVLL
jgi:hypothetical protein